MDRDSEIRLLRQNILAMSKRIQLELDAIDQKLAAMETEPRSFQIPKSWDGFCENYAKSSRNQVRST